MVYLVTSLLLLRSQILRVDKVKCNRGNIIGNYVKRLLVYDVGNARSEEIRQIKMPKHHKIRANHEGQGKDSKHKVTQRENIVKSKSAILPSAAKVDISTKTCGKTLESCVENSPKHVHYSASASTLGHSKRKKNKKKKNIDNAGTQLAKSMSKLDINSNKKKSPNKSPITLNKRTLSTHSAGSGRSSRLKVETLEDVARLILSGRVKNIVVMAGAGISTASGIPDFRSPGTGLYDNLRKYNVPYPTAIFDLQYFNDQPKPFFELAKELYPSGRYRPNLAHYFIRTLHEKGLLLRLYTQNIDGLERLAGIPPAKLVEAHGTFNTASCTKCGKKYNGEAIKHKIFKGLIPRCELTPLCWGIIKPDIVFFGEDLPKRFYYYVKDFPLCDLLIVMGTSLEVEPFASLVDSPRFNVPRLLLNRERVGPFKSNERMSDAVATGDLTETVQRFSTVLGWKKFVEETMSSHERAAKSDETTESTSDNHQRAAENEEASESSSDSPTDSGISSASSVSSEQQGSKPSRRPHPPPIDTNIKRYFHTIRSTPLPKLTNQFNPDERGSGDPNSSVSYYDFIKKTSKPQVTNQNITTNSSRSGKKLMELFTLSKTHAPTIQYAETINKRTNKKNLSSVSMPTILRRMAVQSDSSDSQSESTDSDTSTDS